MMRIFRSADYRRMPWKNGGGETTEIAVSPDGASADGFDWRLSMATVASGGPFSVFAGIDRTLAVLDGDGLSLTIEGMGTIELATGSAPLPFPGDARTSAELSGGTVIDLNIMTRRGRLAHKMRRLDVSGAMEIAVAAAELLVFCQRGTCRLATASETAVLGPLDTAHFSAAPRTLRVESDAPARLFLIELSPEPHAQ
jgi:environmental stress-induced protein Ves